MQHLNAVADKRPVPKDTRIKKAPRWFTAELPETVHRGRNCRPDGSQHGCKHKCLISHLYLTITNITASHFSFKITLHAFSKNTLLVGEAVQLYYTASRL